MTRREEPIPALSAGLSHVVLTGLFLAAALPTAPPPGSTPIARPPAAGLAPPSQPPVTTVTTPAAIDRADPSTTPGAVEPLVAEVWPEDYVVRGREQCMHLLSSTSAEIEWLDPVKKGACGLPAPVKLTSVGSGEKKIVFDPPVHVNCRMVVALAAWGKQTVQPKAEERFASRVVGIVGASGYACRNIYNRENARLSQHALANAIDLGGFRLADGRTVGVLKGWGLTQRDIKARAIAAARSKKKSQDAKSEAVAEAKSGEARKSAALLADQAGKNLARASLAPRLRKTLTKDASPEMPAAGPAKPTKEALFLRDIHGGACREFGTVLGPEANDPHRNHFHLDLIARRVGGFCQ